VAREGGRSAGGRGKRPIGREEKGERACSAKLSILKGKKSHGDKRGTDRRDSRTGEYSAQALPGGIQTPRKNQKKNNCVQAVVSAD